MRLRNTGEARVGRSQGCRAPACAGSVCRVGMRQWRQVCRAVSAKRRTWAFFAKGNFELRKDRVFVCLFVCLAVLELPL